MKRIEDRPGHDRRYAVSSAKAEAIGWHKTPDFDAALKATIFWYRDHESWWRPLKNDAEYRAYYQQNYAVRLAQAGN